MTAYEQLVERCALASVNAVAGATQAKDADVIVIGTVAVLREVLRTLETVTPEMIDACIGTFATNDWRKMLRASPLAPQDTL